MDLCNFILGKKAQNFILAVIVINAITLGMETSQSLVASTGPLLSILDKAALAIFVVEIVLKIIALRLKFVKDAWNIFDFVIVAIAMVPATSGFSVLRALRVLRVLRLISSLPKLRLLVQAMLHSLPSIGWVTLLMFVLFYIFAVVATKLFGAAFPEWFGSLGATFFTLFQVMTLESWSMGIARPVMEAFPSSWLFFVPFVLLSSFVVLNLFIAIIVNGMSEAKAETVDNNEVKPVQGVDQDALGAMSGNNDLAAKVALDDKSREIILAELASLRDQVKKIEGILSVK